MSEPKKIVIVGASAAGLRCACRVKRLQPRWSVTVVEANEVFSYGACGMPYVLSGDIEELGALRRTPYGTDRDEAYFSSVKGVDVLSPWRATAIDPEAKTLTIIAGDDERVMDYDELENGKRREGAFSACGSWIMKAGMALGMWTSGFILEATGFDAKLGGDQSEHAITMIRVYLAVFPVVGLLIALFFLARFGLTRERMMEVREQLEARRGKV